MSVCSTVREAKPSWHSTLYDSCFCVHGNSGCTPRRCRHLSSPSRQSSDLPSSWPPGTLARPQPERRRSRHRRTVRAAASGVGCRVQSGLARTERWAGGVWDVHGRVGGILPRKKVHAGANPSLSSPRPYIAPPLPRFLSLLPPPCLQIHPSSRPQTSLPRSP